MKQKTLSALTIIFLVAVIIAQCINISSIENQRKNPSQEAMQSQSVTQSTTQATTKPVVTLPPLTTTLPLEEPQSPDTNNSNLPDTPEEVVSKYTLLVDKFKQQKPAYKKREYQALPEEYRKFSNAINFVLDIAAGYMVSEEECEELIRPAGAQEILMDMPIHGTEKGCTLTDYDAVQWAKGEELGDGTYKLSFSLKEEINADPTPADTLIPASAHGAVMQPMKFTDIKNEVNSIASKIPGVSINALDLYYRDCVFSCVYNPETDEVLSITHNIVIDILADVSVFGGEINGTARLLNEMFIYDITW